MRTPPTPTHPSAPAARRRRRHRRALLAACTIVSLLGFFAGIDPAAASATTQAGAHPAGRPHIVLALGAGEVAPVATVAAADGLVTVVDGHGLPVTRTKLTWGIVTGTLYFNVPETQNMKSAGSLGAACGFAAAIPQPGGAIIGTYCAANWAYLVYVATIADSHSDCLKIKFGLGYSNPAAQTYSGGYCTK